MLNQSKGVFNMRDQRKAETIAQQRMELISPLLAEGLDPAKAKEIKARICEQTGISERTLRRYVAQYREAGFDGLKPKGKSQRKTEDAIPSHVLEQAILLRRQVPSRRVRFLLNFKMDSESPMALILVGQSELWDKFQLQAYAAIKQRIDIQCKLNHYDRAQVGEYVHRHLEYAACDREIFSEAALDEIFKYSSGSARLINKLCTHCLLFGAQNGRKIIDDHMVKLVIQGELA
jgi:type II secretory pathway predicted ATPase ExeA